MAVTNEEKRYNDLMGSAPATSHSAQTEQSAAALAAAERAAQQGAQDFDYGKTADARLDKAISDYLNQLGYNYDINNDEAYREFAKEYSQNALRGRELSENTARDLTNGYSSTYARAVGSEVTGDAVMGYTRYAPQLSQLAKQEAAAKQAQAGNAANVYQRLADTDYQRARDTQSDRQAMMAYLQSRYITDRQADVQQGANLADIYSTRLSGAASDLANARSIDNSRYQYLTQSADSKARIAQSNYEANQKLAYQKAEDSYNEKIAAQKAAAEAAQKAQKEAQTAAEDYKKNMWKIANYLNGSIKLGTNDKYNLDYNKDGKVDTKDAVIAARIANGTLTQAQAEQMARQGTGNATVGNATSGNNSVFNFEATDRTRGVITNIREEKRSSSLSTEELAKKWIEKSDLTDSESAYIYHYFGL